MINPINEQQRHEIESGARQVLEAAWNEELGCCFPNRSAYAHQWLWDSCFHVVAWAHYGDQRGVTELASLLSTQLDNGFLPHMRYSSESQRRGPLVDRSSFTQPPIYAHALKSLIDAGLDPGDDVVRAVGQALEHLWMSRRAANGLIYIVHPWESGTDDSPRWDSWLGVDHWDLERLAAHDIALVDQTYYDSFGAATWSTKFVACPASFNAFASWAFQEYGEITGESIWQERAEQLADRIDVLMWNSDEHLWNDIALLGGGVSASIPTVDGTLPALVTGNRSYAMAALDQLIDQNRFCGPFGTTYLVRTDPLFLADIYWRGPSWPNLEYMFVLAADHWSRDDVAGSVAAAAAAGVLTAGFAEYWNPLTGLGHGARPQTWSAVVASFGGIAARGSTA